MKRMWWLMTDKATAVLHPKLTAGMKSGSSRECGSMVLKTKPFRRPAPPDSPISPDAAVMGPRVTPLEHMQLMSPPTWENVTCEWVHSLGLHARIEKYGGSGDQGLDVVAFESASSNETWDTYQCKHYDYGSKRMIDRADVGPT